MFWYRLRTWVSSRKRELAALTTAVAIVSVAAVATDTPQTSDTVTVPRADVEAVIAELQSWLDTTTTTGPTTTQTPTTTGEPTTTVAPTTTQSPTTTGTPTTIIVIPTTTTTPDDWPAQSGPSFDFFVNIAGLGNSIRIWNAAYFRELTSDAEWADGNRDGYKCSYAILLLPNGDPGGRVTFTRIPGAAYATIVDEQMPENGPTNRHYDTGLLTPTPVRQGECPPPSEGYEPNDEAGQRPVIDYLAADGSILERRDYRILQSSFLDSGRLKFHLTDVTPERVTVVAFWDNNPIVAIYYDSMSPDVTMNGYVP